MDDWKTILTILSFLGGVPTVTLMDHPWLPCRVILGYDMGSVPSINHFLEWWNLWLKRPQEVLKSGVLVCWGINSKSSSIYYDVCNCLISSWSQYRTHTHTISQYHSKIPSFLHSFVFFASIHRIDFLWKVRGPWIPMISPYIFPLSPMISRFSPYPRTSGRMTPNIEAVFTYPLVMAHPCCFKKKAVRNTKTGFGGWIHHLYKSRCQ